MKFFNLRIGVAALTAALALGAASTANAVTVYTSSNDAGGNRILTFESKGATGAFIEKRPVSTGGLGSGGGLGSQDALTLARNGRVLLAVNAGSNDVSTFRVRRNGVRLIGVYPSGGVMPTSVAVHDDLVYVMNAGGETNVSAFRLERDGSLTPIPNSTRSLSVAASAPAQVGFNGAGDALVVTERATNNIRVFPVDEDGLLGEPVDNASSGQTPFGFTFDRRDNLLVSEAFGGAQNQAALSSYGLNIDDLSLETVTGSASADQTAACWVVTSRNGRYAYVTNTGSGTVTGYSVGRTGAVTRLSNDPVTGVTGGNPLDASVRANTMFVLTPRNGEIVPFKIEHDGSLTRERPISGVSTTAAGVVAW